MHGLLVFQGFLVQSEGKNRPTLSMPDLKQLCVSNLQRKMCSGVGEAGSPGRWWWWCPPWTVILVVPISLRPEWQIHHKQPKAAGIKGLPESSQFLQGLSISVLISVRGMLWKCNPLPSFNLQPRASQLNRSIALTVCWIGIGADTETSALTGTA